MWAKNLNSMCVICSILGVFLLNYKISLHFVLVKNCGLATVVNIVTTSEMSDFTIVRMFSKIDSHSSCIYLLIIRHSFR